jgi:2-iminobutanoate/2-iminopropanoate deaminase
VDLGGPNFALFHPHRLDRALGRRNTPLTQHARLSFLQPRRWHTTLFRTIASFSVALVRPEKEHFMNRRVGIVLALLLVAGIFTVAGLSSQPTPQAVRKYIDLPGKTVQAPFSDAVLTGNTLYLAGRIGLDPKTGKAPDKIEDEIKLLLDGEKDVLAQAGMTMDDLVYVQISCTDLSLFEKFNPIYKSYFTKEMPAREFIGAASLLRGGHFELQAIAVKR